MKLWKLGDRCESSEEWWRLVKESAKIDKARVTDSRIISSGTS